MRKFGKESAAPARLGDEGRRKDGSGWFRNHWCLVSLCAIVVVAFLLRTVFAYGVSAGGDFALSGGSSAQNHLHVVESILNGTFAIGTDAAVNYPFGGLNVVPPLMDFLAAGVACICGMFGLGTTEAASAALAVLPPILGALTCIPVYAVAKEFFDEKKGVVAALIFAFLALPISSSVFSNGTEYALAGFLIACMSYFLVRTVKKMESDAPAKSVYVSSLITGVFLGLIALTWNGFGLMIMVVAAPMLLQVVVDRIKGKDFTTVLVGHTVTLLVGVAMAAVYYMPAGLWDAVFSGPFLLAVLAIVFGFLFKAFSGRPWINTIPILFVVFAVILVALYFAAPEMFTALVYGNPIYTGTMTDMVSNHVSMSNVSSYYGWLTMWLPICLALYEIYVYLRSDRSATRLLLITWLMLMFFAVWSGYSSAAVVGVVFAVGSAAVIVDILVRADLREWVKSIRFAGFPSGFRKLIKPLPFASVLITALLVIAPNFTYAVDAGMSNNVDGDHIFSGNTQYVIKTGDSYPIGSVWDEYADMDKDGAAVIWLDYVADALAQGNFTTVADSYGEGAEATAQMILSKGSSGMTAAMIVRLMMHGDIDGYATALPADVFDKVKTFIAEPSKAQLEIVSNPDAYGDVRSDIVDENAVYLASIEVMTSEMNQIELAKAYDAVRATSQKAIDYVILDPSLLPIAYGGGDGFSSLAYFAGYDVDGYGAIPEYFTYNTTYGYTTYTDAMYETFLWKALVGPSAKDAGFTSSYSYLYSLSASDGSVVAMPGYGLAGYDVAFWQVMYNADSKATSASDGWEYMAAADAIAKQKADGGLINYLSSIVVLQYVGISDVDSGILENSAGEGYEGLVVEVYQYDTNADNYCLMSYDVTDSNGAYDIMKVGADDKVVIRNGALVLFTGIGAVPSIAGLEMAKADAFVYVGDNKLENSNMAASLTNVTTGDEVLRADVAADGKISIADVIPGEYKLDIVDASGTPVSSTNVTLVPGDNIGLKVIPKSYNITVTVKDVDGRLADAGVKVAAIETTTNVVFTADTGEDGKAVIAALPGSYRIFTDMPSATMPTVTVSKSNTTASIVITEEINVAVDIVDMPLFVYAGDYSQVVAFDNVTLPQTMATEKVLYTVYGTDGTKVIMGIYDGTVKIPSAEDAYKVSGTTAAGATVSFIAANGATVKAVADSDGKYSVYLPAGDFTVQADNGKDKAYIGSVTVSDHKSDLDITLDNGRAVSLSVKYQSGTSSGYINQPFVYVKATLEVNAVTYNLYDMTDSNGKATFIVPDNVKVSLVAGDDDGVYSNASFTIGKFTKEVSSGASDSSSTLYIYNKTTPEADDNYVNKVSVTPAYDAELTYYSDKDRKYTFEAGQAIDVLPGQYTVVIKTDSKYFDGTVNIYPGDSAVYGLEPVDVVKVTLTKGGKDVVSVDSEGGKYWKDGDSYWFQIDDADGNKVVYTIKSTNSSGEEKKVAYAVVDTGATVPATIDVTANDVQMSITGSVGVDADGTITVKNGTVALDFDVKDGQYTMTLPSTWAAVTVDVDVEAEVLEYDSTYSVAGFELTGLVDGAVRNVPVITTAFDPTGDSDLALTIESMVNYADRAEITVKLTGGEAGMTYVVTPGDAWTFDRIVSITNDATASFVAYYDEKCVSMLESGLTITATSINNDDSVTIHATVSDAGTGSVVVNTDVTDVVTASQYRYAISVDNSANMFPVDALLTVSGVVDNILVDGDGNKWYVTFADALYVKGKGEFRVAANTSDYMLYVCLMSLDGKGSVPNITVSYAVGSETGSATLEAQSLDLSVEDMSASGGSALDTRSGIPAGVWFLLAVGLLLVVATVYLASKRGVFSRRK